MVRLAEELRFYLSFLDVADSLAEHGVAWCRPRVLADPDAAVDVRGLVDVALALHPGTSETGAGTPIPNDLVLGPGRATVFVTGPNSGGKTTLARAVGQLAYLASLGLPVPARSATLPLWHPVLSHFPRPDDPGNARGGLAEELHRLRELFDAASGQTLVILNELFATTSVDDALQLSRLALRRLRAIGCRTLWVTFLDELVTCESDAVSLVGQLDPDDPTVPTFRFLPQPPTGRSQAAALAARHGLSAADLTGRLS